MKRVWNTTKEENENKADLFSTDPNKIEIIGNNIYFYNEIDQTTTLNLNKELKTLADKMITLTRTNGLPKPTINLHINSPGGDVYHGISIMDTIIKLKEDINIDTYVEGISASAGTFISLVGTTRYITRHSYMLIHQLSSGMFGSYKQLKDSMSNFDELMIMIKSVYGEYTKVSSEELDGILSHDLVWNAEKCLKLGLVDVIV
jgi:ATP-dependent protease ClpP protease subunit